METISALHLILYGVIFLFVYRGIYCKKREENTEKVIGEVGDLFFNMVSICYRLGIDVDKLPEYAANTLGKFEERKALYLASKESKK